MQFLKVVVVIVAVLATCVTAQCPGRPRNRSCQGGLHLGNGGRGCNERTMWWYDRTSRSCKEMRYKGCGGNDNRHCTKASCEQRCGRR